MRHEETILQAQLLADLEEELQVVMKRTLEWLTAAGNEVTSTRDGATAVSLLTTAELAGAEMFLGPGPNEAALMTTPSKRRVNKEKKRGAPFLLLVDPPL